jgi:hypothetical protein
MSQIPDSSAEKYPKNYNSNQNVLPGLSTTYSIHGNQQLPMQPSQLVQNNHHLAYHHNSEVSQQIPIPSAQLFSSSFPQQNSIASSFAEYNGAGSHSQNIPPINGSAYGVPRGHNSGGFEPSGPWIPPAMRGSSSSQAQGSMKQPSISQPQRQLPQQQLLVLKIQQLRQMISQLNIPTDTDLWQMSSNDKIMFAQLKHARMILMAEEDKKASTSKLSAKAAAQDELRAAGILSYLSRLNFFC